MVEKCRKNWRCRPRKPRKPKRFPRPLLLPPLERLPSRLKNKNYERNKSTFEIFENGTKKNKIGGGFNPRKISRGSRNGFGISRSPIRRAFKKALAFGHRQCQA